MFKLSLFGPLGVICLGAILVVALSAWYVDHINKRDRIAEH